MSAILTGDEDDDERAVLVRGASGGPWPRGAGLRLPGEEVLFVARPRAWVRPGLAYTACAAAVVVGAVVLAVTAARPSPYLALVPALLGLAESARTAWWQGTRYVITSARVLRLRGLASAGPGAEVAASRARVDDASTPARVVTRDATLPLAGLDAAEVAAVAMVLDDPRAARGVTRTRYRRSGLGAVLA